MPTDWSTTTLGDCADFFSGGTPRKSNNDYWGGIIPWFSGKSLKSFYLSDSEDHVTEEGAEAGSRLMPAGTILLLVRGMTLHNDVPIGVLTREATFNQDIKALRARSGVHQSFLVHWLISQKRRLLSTVHAAGHGTGVLATDRLHALELELPPPDEQAAIADIFDLIEDKIEQNRRTGRALEGLARATFKAWFVDFEPVKAKAAGSTSFPRMPSAAFTALPDRLTESPLGPVPQGWEVQTIGAVTTLSKQQIEPQDHADELFEHFSIPAYDEGQNPVVELGGGIMSQKFVVMSGCVLLSKLNPRIPRVWIPAPANGRRQIASTEFLVAVPRPGWPREFLYCLFQQADFRDSLAQSASGTSNSHQRVRPSDLLARPLIVPPKSIVAAFADQVVPEMALREALQAESSKLAALRDYLLPRLLSGRVRVRSLQARIASIAFANTEDPS